jgi:anhydro-N-acetylmuramic acid kinase
MTAIKTCLGLMSGTSLDGIDLALLETDGEAHIRPLRDGFQAYDASTRAALREALDIAAALPTPVLADLALWPSELISADALVTQAHIEAVQNFLRANHHPNHHPNKESVSLVGFHGQTLVHRPDEGFTLQIGDGQALAQALGVDVVGQFRRADMAAGGQGAPLAPLFHAALVHAEPSSDRQAQAVLNLGGIANITWLGAPDNLLAFDTGPANALLDDWVQQKTAQAYDENGTLAANGEVDPRALAALMAHPFFTAPPPKSLDRLGFDMAPIQALSAEDGAATLTAFTAASVAAGLALCLAPPSRLILCGGGRHNKTLVRALEQTTQIEVINCDALGWRGDALEAQAFAWLAMRSLKGLPLSQAETTGVGAPTSGGELYSAG